MLLKVSLGKHASCQRYLSNGSIEFEMLHDDEVIPKYATEIVIGRVKGQTPSLEI